MELSKVRFMYQDKVRIMEYAIQVMPSPVPTQSIRVCQLQPLWAQRAMDLQRHTFQLSLFSSLVCHPQPLQAHGIITTRTNGSIKTHSNSACLVYQIVPSPTPTCPKNHSNNNQWIYRDTLRGEGRADMSSCNRKAIYSCLINFICECYSQCFSDLVSISV